MSSAVLPDFVAPSQPLRRATAVRINQVGKPEARQGTLALSGLGKLIPVVYGEDRVQGLHLVAPRVYSGELLMAVAWSWGECQGVQGDIIINGESVPGGVTVTHYTGTSSQTADPTLSAAIPGFSKTFPNIAYSVISVPTGTITGFPASCRIEAVFRGRKVFDPRDSSTAWSENPALCLRDFITSTNYGPGLPVYGTEDCADRCDNDLGAGELRAKLGLTLATAQTLDDTIDLLSMYAECLWSYDGDGVLLVPDAPVESPAAVLTRSDIREGSMRLTCADLASAPTSVTVTYKSNSGGDEAWKDETQNAALPGIDTGEVQEITSDVSMPGIRRATEAYRKALGRLRRLQHPGKYAWQGFDDAVKFRRGGVVQLPDMRGLQSVLVRIVSNEMIAPGRYQLTAEHYSPTLYPDDVVVTEDTTVPVGGIIALNASEVPAGYELFTAADGKFLRGAGSGLTRGDTGGSTTVTVSGTTTANGGHSGDGDDTPWLLGSDGGAGSGFKLFNELDEDPHDHDYDTSFSHTPLYRRLLLVKKTGSAGQIPVNGGVFANGELISAAFEAVTTHVGRMVQAGTLGEGGNSSPRYVSVPLDPVDDHEHRATDRALSSTSTFGPPAFTYKPAGAHQHGANPQNVTIEPKRKKLALYVATSSTNLGPGAIIGWDSDEDPPAGFAVCDGGSGTEDLRDYFIEISTPVSAGTAVGDNTATWNGYTPPDGQHGHKDAAQGNRTVSAADHDENAGLHSHTVSGSSEHIPVFYVMRFIQFVGS